MITKTRVTLLVAMAATALLAGCGSDSTTTLTAIDAAPPAAPANLRAQDVDGCVSLVWDPNYLDADLAGYLVWRVARGQSRHLVPRPQPQTSYTDRAPTLGCLNTYLVCAVDANGNQSALASVRVQVGSGGYTPMVIDTEDSAFDGQVPSQISGAHDWRTHHR